MAVNHRLDVDDDLVTHFKPSLERRRAHVRQYDNLVLLDELQHSRRNRWLVLEHVKPCPQNLAIFDHFCERRLVNDLATGRVHDNRMRL